MIKLLLLLLLFILILIIIISLSVIRIVGGAAVLSCLCTIIRALTARVASSASPLLRTDTRTRVTNH